MFSIVRKEILRPTNTTAQIKRFRAKINIQKPRQPHFERAKYIALTQQYFEKRERKPLYETCDKDVRYFKKEVDIEYPYQRILANELIEHFNNSRLIAFFHKNPFSSEEECKARVMFKKENMILIGYGKKTLEMAVKGTKYETVLDFYVSHNAMVFSPEPEIKKLLKISKKFRPLVLLAAIVEGRFINRDDIQKYSTIPNIMAAQSELVQTLNNVGGQIASHLNVRSNILVSQMQERIKQLGEEK